MCGRYILVQKLEVLEKRFNVKAPEGFEYRPAFNISPGNYAPVITDENPKTLSLLRFGMTPFWAKKPMMLINARSEGDHNAEDDPDYKGAKGIITKPAFRKPIRSQRCLVLADAFIEGTTTEKLNKPFLVYLRNKERPFALAGIWDKWANPETGEIVHSYAIITITANELLRKLPHHRSPVILPRHYEQAWLRQDLPLSDVTAMLRPFPAELMNAYPISNAIRNPWAEGAELLKPIGDTIYTETQVKRTTDVRLQGMGTGKRWSEPGEFLVTLD